MRVDPPINLVTNNGANFTSKKFTVLMRKYGVEHAKGSPHHHQGNGIAEKSVDTLKRLLKKVPKASSAVAPLAGDGKEFSFGGGSGKQNAAVDKTGGFGGGK